MTTRNIGKLVKCNVLGIFLHLLRVEDPLFIAKTA